MMLTTQDNDEDLGSAITEGVKDRTWAVGLLGTTALSWNRRDGAREGNEGEAAIPRGPYGNIVI